MNFNFEALGDEDFQRLVQALLTATHGDVQCFPLGKADGGRDAVHYLSGPHQFYVYQVKWSNHPARIDDAESWAQRNIGAQVKKVDRLAERGARQFFFVTNVEPTAALASGNIDVVQQYMDEHLPIPGRAWWRDDLARRLESHEDLWWSYPAMLPATALLARIFKGDDTKRRRQERVLKAYFREQYSKDISIRFKQVDLTNDLFDLFVDVPIRLEQSEFSRG